MHGRMEFLRNKQSVLYMKKLCSHAPVKKNYLKIVYSRWIAWYRILTMVRVPLVTNTLLFTLYSMFLTVSTVPCYVS